MKYYLQNLNQGYVGNNPVWWAKGGNGYTSYIDNAELFDESEAKKYVDHDSEKWRMYRTEDVEKAIYRTVDVQKLPNKKQKKKSK